MAVEWRLGTGVTLIDEEDAHLMTKYGWYLARPRGKTCYVQAAHAGTVILLHRVILNAPSGFMVDHVDRDGLNNQKSNLRLATNAQNQYNTLKARGTSKYKGVSWHLVTGKWRATIRANGLRKQLGVFEDEEMAHEAYKKASMEMHGEFSPYRGGA
jgi:hypothetical protein